MLKKLFHPSSQVNLNFFEYSTGSIYLSALKDLPHFMLETLRHSLANFWLVHFTYISQKSTNLSLIPLDHRLLSEKLRYVNAAGLIDMCHKLLTTCERAQHVGSHSLSKNRWRGSQYRHHS
jgi:hypothetical protein